ncbi:MAG: hypothetical protein KKB45_09645, partial [Gammaproteobacteria bacterium]|nr:hypothetical protein [Gammaproteobacteria bacterium]
MTPIFKKLNLGAHTVIHVLNPPESFEPELAALAGISVKRAVEGTAAFAMAFVMTEGELNEASSLLAEACVGDAVLWIVYPKG